MSIDKKIFLIGFMGAGKSSIGKKLAQSLLFRFVDLDVLIEKQQKKSISAIFEKEGEKGFRKIEQQVLYSLKDEANIVIATGGGCPTFEKNLKWMNTNGKTIYLKCSIGILFHRIAPEKKSRPLIAVMDDVDIMDFIIMKLRERSSFYEKASLVVDGDGDIEEVCSNILNFALIKNIV